MGWGRRATRPLSCLVSNLLSLPLPLPLIQRGLRQVALELAGWGGVGLLWWVVMK